MSNLILAVMRFLAKVLKWDTVASTDNSETVLPINDPVVPSSVPSPIIPNAIPNTPPEPNLELLEWSTPRQAFHSTRVLCDEMGLTYEQKNEICYTIYRESEFNIKAIGKPNNNGTRDYGICQFNDGKNAKGIPFWIGKGATFASIDEVLNNPEKCVRVMIQTYKAGHIEWWYGHDGYSVEAARTSPMWKLA